MSETTNTPNLPDPKKADAAAPEHATTEHVSTTPTAPAATTPTTTTTTATPKPRSRKRTALVAGGSVLAALLLAGGGVAVGAAIADEQDDDGDEMSSASAADADDERDDAGDQDDAAGSDDAAGQTDDADDLGSAAVAAGLGAASAADLVEIVDAAASEAEGTAVGMDAGADGSWDVEFRTGAGDETEVRVASDGTAKVVSTEAADDDDAGEPAPQGALDAATLKALVTAALGEVDGRIVDVEIDDDTTSPYDVSVLTGEGRTVDIALDADFAVVTAGAED